MSGKYILDEQGEPVLVDVMTWARWFEKNAAARIVAQYKDGDVFVSTVFLGIDHSWTGGPPILWETMIFGDPRFPDWTERYTSKADALSGHELAVALVSVL